LNAARRDLDFMIVEMPVPLDGRQLSCQVFGNKVLDADQRSLGIGGFKQQALKNLVGNALTVMMEWAAWRPVSHHVRRLDMNVVPDRWACRLPAHSLLWGHSGTSDGSDRNNS
jgi:hypothetical protein